MEQSFSVTNLKGKTLYFSHNRQGQVVLCAIDGRDPWEMSITKYTDCREMRHGFLHIIATRKSSLLWDSSISACTRLVDLL